MYWVTCISQYQVSEIRRILLQYCIQLGEIALDFLTIVNVFFPSMLLLIVKKEVYQFIRSVKETGSNAQIFHVRAL